MFFSLDDASRLFLGMERRCVACEMWNEISSNIYMHFIPEYVNTTALYRGADKSLARPTSRCILFDGENISFDASLFIYINSINIPPIIIINRIFEYQNLLSL